MKLGKLVLATAALSLATANVALAGPKTIVSAPASVNYPQLSGRTLHCNIVNIDPALSQDVTIETVEPYSGVVCSTVGPTTLAPYQATTAADATFCGACRFTVNTSTKKFRAVAAYENGTAYTVANPAN